MKIRDADLRECLRVGDTVLYESMKACDDALQVDRNTPLLTEGLVLSVYEKFAIVKLKRVEDTANRQHILKINDRDYSFGRECTRW